MSAMRWSSGQDQQKRLRRSRVAATGMLASAGIVFAGTLAVSDPSAWVLLLRSVAEAALVGGLADWFAITALFARWFPLPIPHTAIVPANKDRITVTVAPFFIEYLLQGNLVVAELHI